MAVSQSSKRAREVDDYEDIETSQVQQKSAGPPSKKSRIEERRTLFVRSLGAEATNDTLVDFFSQHYPVKHATVVLDPKTKTSRGYGFVTFTDADDAVEAAKKLNNQLLAGKRFRLEVAEPRARDGKNASGRPPSQKVGINRAELAKEKKKRVDDLAETKKLPKLIIRNLPWSIKKSDQLAKIFEKYGKPRYVDLPNDKGKLSGFGFVTMKSRKHAQKAMEELNGTQVDGRPIAVDWAVSKEEWKQQQDNEEEDSGSEDESDKGVKTNGPTKKAKEANDKSTEGMTEEEADIANFMRDFGEELESEDEDEEDDGAVLDEEDEQGGEDDEDDDGEAELASQDEEPKPVAKRMTDNSTVVFIRNLPFTTTDESLKTHFTQFGPLRYARTVMDRTTGRPAGSGFVCFVKDEDFMTCLKNAPRQKADTKMNAQSVLQNANVDTDGRFTIEGRVLIVTQAVSKDEAGRLTEASAGARKGQDKDKRRLYLLSEGTIPRGSALHDLLSPQEIKIRDTSSQQRKKQIQNNPSLHMSLTRLAIRNLPRNMDSKALKQLAREAVVGFAKDAKQGRRQPLSREELIRGGQEDKDAEHKRKEKGRGVVKQAKIVFESKQGTKVEEKVGAGRSRGYGFVEYSSHRWALMGLRWLNGHPLENEAGKTVRLIVEFAIENAQVVSRRRAAEDKFRARETAAGGAGGGEKKSKAPVIRGHGRKRKLVVEVAKKSEGEKKQEAAKPMKKDAADKLAMRQRIIGRKRMARKQKKAGR